MEEKKIKRKSEEINQDYANLCAQLGDIEIKKGALTFQANELIKKISHLARELDGDVDGKNQ